MKEILQLYKHGFDNMENHNPYTSELLATFQDDETATAHKKAGDFLAGLDYEKIKPYLGWDGNVYPRFEAKRVMVQ